MTPRPWCGMHPHSSCHISKVFALPLSLSSVQASVVKMIVQSSKSSKTITSAADATDTTDGTAAAAGAGAADNANKPCSAQSHVPPGALRSAMQHVQQINISTEVKVCLVRVLQHLTSR